MTTAISANPGQTISLALNTNDGYGSTFDSIQETIAVNINGQVKFILSEIPSFPNSVMMFVNGIKQTFSIDFYILGATAIFLNNGITLVTTDKVDFYYLTSSLNGNSGNVTQENIPVLINGQTSFTLSNVPASSSSVIMFVNGVKQVQTFDYNIAGQNITFLNNSFTLTTADEVDFYYVISGSPSDGYIPQIQSIFFPNGSVVAGYPQPMNLLSGSVWKYNVTLPSSVIGTFIVLASYISSSENFIKTEVFLINTFKPFGNAFVSPA